MIFLFYEDIPCEKNSIWAIFELWVRCLKSKKIKDWWKNAQKIITCGRFDIARQPKGLETFYAPFWNWETSICILELKKWRYLNYLGSYTLWNRVRVTHFFCQKNLQRSTLTLCISKSSQCTEILQPFLKNLAHSDSKTRIKH